MSNTNKKLLIVVIILAVILIAVVALFAGFYLGSKETPVYTEAFTAYERFMITGKFSFTGSGRFGLAFDFGDGQDDYKLISLDPENDKLMLNFGGGATLITETAVSLEPGQSYSFTYIQEGSVGVFYIDGEAALTVRLYGVSGKPVRLFAENNTVTFTELKEQTTKP